MNQVDAIKKILSKNDTGETGGHQAGMLIPKDPEILSFFPILNNKVKNPRVLLNFYDIFNTKWSFAFIYYNNKFFGGTRNEYRLTGMTKFFKANKLNEGDSVILERDFQGFYKVGLQKMKDQIPIDGNKLVLSNKWVTVKIK
jgi:hypothetical protein